MTLNRPKSVDPAPAVPALVIRTMGRFDVRQGESVLPESIWQRQKARTLFQYFITHPNQLTARERIIGDLWPRSRPNQGQRDFKVALNALSQALQPDRSPRSLSAYISRQGTSYGLNPAPPTQLDYLEFEAQLTRAGQVERQESHSAVPIYREALALYQGEYLPDTIYQDWSAATRERLTALFLTGASRLAALLVEVQQQLEAISWCQRILDIDDCWEEAYRLLMTSYVSSGNRPKAVRTYESCRSALDEQLGLEPMPETRRLYEEIVSQGT